MTVCVPCTPAAVRLSFDGRLWWMATFAQSPHAHGCEFQGAPTLAKARLGWLMFQALRHPGGPCVPMPHDPQPEFWPSHARSRERTATPFVRRNKHGALILPGIRGSVAALLELADGD